MMLPMSENGIFWNVYEQECRFRGVIKRPPRFARTTCDKLATLYPDLDDAEMFMRAQFVMKCEGIDYYLPEIVFSFKDFINPRHGKIFEQYREESVERIAQKIDVAKYYASNMSLNATALSPFDRFLREGDDSPEEVQDTVVVDCLHWPALTDVLAITEYMENRIRFFKDEVRATERPSRHSGDSKYLIDFSDI